MSSGVFIAVLVMIRLIITLPHIKYIYYRYTYGKDTRIGYTYHKQSYYELTYHRSTCHDYSRSHYTYTCATSRKGRIVVDIPHFVVCLWWIVSMVDSVSW